MALPAPSRRSTRSTSSAIRDILVHARRHDVVSLAGGVPAPETFPIDILADATATALAKGADSLQYGLTAGETATRAVLADWVGSATPPVEDIVVTTGSQQGLELLTQAFVDPGARVVVGEFDYLGAIGVFRAHGAAVHTVPVDGEGIDVDRLAEDLRRGLRPVVVYTVPNHHNPTGATLTRRRGDDLVTLAERHGFLVVEDDPYRELGEIGTAPTTLPASPNVVRLRSASKILAPGLRCGWLVATSEVVDAVAVVKQSADLHTSTFSQAIVAAALSDPRFPGHLVRVAETYTRRRAHLESLLAAELPGLDVAAARGGMFLWVGGTGVDTAALLPAAIDAGVAYVPGAVFDPSGNRSDRMRLSFATAGEAEMAHAVVVLRELLASERPAAN